jgi:NAD(P)H dehydrogenase (quinone)
VKLLVVYYSEKGGTKRMAGEIGKGAERFGVRVVVKGVEGCGIDDLVGCDGFVVGSPTYFSNVAWQIKKLIDESIVLYRKNHLLKTKVCGCFASAGTMRDGKECVRMLELAFGFHHGAKMVPGIVSESGDSEADVSRMCRDYGMEIARQLVA